MFGVNQFFLRCLSSRLSETSLGARKPLIHYAPECGDGFCLSVEEIFKEAGLVQWWRIRVSLSIVAEFSNPINGLTAVD
jgi:hypothetical protein